MDNDLINKAYLFALEVHKDEKYGEQDFISHPLQVYEVISLLKPDDIPLRVASLLHDCIESGVTKKQIEKEFGEDVAQLVEEVSKTSYNTFPKLESTRGVILKFADRLCNLANMQDWTKERQTTYIQKSTFWKS